jgi:hypothetical protein
VISNRDLYFLLVNHAHLKTTQGDQQHRQNESQAGKHNRQRHSALLVSNGKFCSKLGFGYWFRNSGFGGRQMHLNG